LNNNVTIFSQCEAFLEAQSLQASFLKYGKVHYSGKAGHELPATAVVLHKKNVMLAVRNRLVMNCTSWI
jgi:hypothetical protein